MAASHLPPKFQDDVTYKCYEGFTHSGEVGDKTEYKGKVRATQKVTDVKAERAEGDGAVIAPPKAVPLGFRGPNAPAYPLPPAVAGQPWAGGPEGDPALTPWSGNAAP